MTDASIPPTQAPTSQSAQTTRAQTAQLEALQEFESLFLAQFVDEMLKTVKVSEAEGQFGGEMWRSFMSEAIADNLIERGGLGITESIGRKMSAYKQNTG